MMKAEVVIVPFPAQGHINPTLAFAKSLASKGIAVSLIIPAGAAQSVKIDDCGIPIHSVSDGSEEEGGDQALTYFDRLRVVYARNVAAFIDEHKSGARAIVYDSMMPWLLDVAKERGMIGASFFPHPCGACAVFYHMGQGVLTFPYDDVTPPVSLPALPPLQKRDLPSFAHVEPFVVKLLTDQFSNLDRADLVFFNTFDTLENEIVQWMRKRWPIVTVGPTFLLDSAGGTGAGDKNDTVGEWLDSKETASVVYVSFGSIYAFGKDQMAELARGLVASGCHFLWVVRPSELNKLPQDLVVASKKDKGLIVEWCSQLDVLAHRAVACFVTHCGWNSIIEAVSSGVPLVAMPHSTDQTMTAMFVEDVWGVGVRLEPRGRGGEDGTTSGEEIAVRIKKVVEGDEIRRNARRWKELAHEAVGIAGTSSINVEAFVQKLLVN